MNRPIWTAILITANVIFNVARTEEDSCSGETTQQGINICTAKAAKAAEAALAAARVDTVFPVKRFLGKYWD